jgi:DNA-binding beta-propeller fold protein YncE
MLALGLAGSTAVAQPAIETPLRLETKITLGSVRGRIDHLDIDLARKHLFVAELENNSVGIVDLGNGKLLHRITGLNEPQGVGYVPAGDLLFVANGGDGVVRLFKGEDFAPTAQVDLGKDADNVRVDTDSRRVFVGYGAGALAVIDPVARAKVADIALQGHPESFQHSHSTDQIFVNVPSARSIAVIDRVAGRQHAIWPTGNNRGNFALALDDGNQRVIVVFRNPPRLAVLDMRNGTSVTERDTCGDADDVFVDAKRKRVYVTCGEGFIDVFDASAAYTRLARISTVAGARTSLLIPGLDLLAVAVRARAPEAAAIWIYRPSP